MAGRTVLITGAGSGLGRALARRYAAAGDAVALVDIRLDRAEEACAELGGAPHAAFQCDVGDDASVERLRDAVLARFGAPHVLVNNAGVASGGSLVDSTPAEWQWVTNINLMGVVRGCRAFVPAMLARGSGHVVNTASFAGLAGAPGIMSYGVAKAGVVALSEQLRAELHRRGLKVSVICPAFFKTNLCENFQGNPRFRELATRLMARAGESAEDIAAAAFGALEAGTFLVIPTARERWLWRLKRWLPDWYFTRLLALAEQHAAVAARP